MSQTKPEDRPRLVVDAWNVFIAGFKSSQLVSSTGKPIGGALFLMRIIAQASENIQAKSIDVVWETDGSPRRRSIYRFYKHGASPTSRVNRPYGEKPEETKQNMLWQIAWVSKLLGLAGCKLYNVPGAEADDVMSHLTLYKYRREKVVLLTGDSDLFQLCDTLEGYDPGAHEETYNPRGHRVRILDSKLRETNGSSLLRHWKIHPSNWAMAKAIVGDTSDNIPGIKGVGWKRVMSIPVLGTPDAMLEDVWKWVEAHPRLDKLKWLQALQKEGNRKIVKRNLRLISLFSISGNQAGVFETQFNADADEWLSQIEWMRETNREGIMQVNLWPGLACEGRRPKDE